MPRGERRATVVVVDDATAALQLGKCTIHVEACPQYQHIHDETQGTELIFHALAIGLAELPLPTMEDVPGQLVPALVARHVSADVAALLLIVEVRQQVQRFGCAAELSQGASEGRNTATTLQ